MLLSAISLPTLASAAIAAAPPSEGPAATPDVAPSSASDGISDIIVTAQKRSDRLSEVPLSINAATGEQLRTAGITGAADLVKIVPGFTTVNTAFGNPVYFIRGIGFNDSTLGVSPAVSIYMDQQPLSFSPMSRGSVLDLERVEVLKGPQGTLFGQNSTGGAINFIAAKPTQTLKAGADFTYGRFGQADGEAYISGPVSDMLAFRVAARTENRSDWQKGYLNNERLGDKRFLNGRISAFWTPSDRVSLLLTANGWRDRSDAQQPQFVKYTPARTGPTARVVPFPVATFPAAPHDARLAAWPLDFNYRLDNWMYSFAGDFEFDLTENIHLASLTSYVKYHQSIPINYGGTNFANAFSLDVGDISTFSQELRISGDVGSRIKWMLGGTYKRDHVHEIQYASPLITSSAILAGRLINGYIDTNDQRIKSRGVFGSVDFKLTDQLTLQGSMRYTKEDRRYIGCVSDTGAGDLAAAANNALRTNIAPGGCVAISSSGQGLQIINNSLDQDNVSYRASLNWKPSSTMLVYANVTKGYKSGSFPTIFGVFATQKDPIGQESVLAYELGAKLRLARKIDITGAAFYYDYGDKQLLGAKKDLIFGVLPALVSIPKSRVAGAEASLSAGPFSGLSFALNGTYVSTRVQRNPVQPTGPFGDAGNFVGEAFPLTPKWQGTASVDYHFALNERLNGYGGASVTGRTSTFNALLARTAAAALNEATYHVPGYILLDLRVGIEAADRLWSVELWGRNVTDRYYTTGTKKVADFVTSFAGMPASYGVTARFRM